MSYNKKYCQAYLDQFKDHNAALKIELIVVLNLYQSLPWSFKPLGFPIWQKYVFNHLKCNKMLHDHLFFYCMYFNK